MKRIFNKKTYWVIGAFVLIGLGIYVAYQCGYVTMQDAIINNPEIKEITVNGEVFEPYYSSHLPPFVSRDYSFPQGIGEHGLTNQFDIDITSLKTVLFVGDQINFLSISAFSVPPNDITQIFILFPDSRTQLLQSYNASQIRDEITNNIFNTPMFELIPSTNQTQLPDVENYEAVKIGTTIPLPPPPENSGSLPHFTFSNEGDKIVQIFVVHNNGRIEYKLDTEPIFTLYPDYARLQVLTDIATIKQNRLQNIADANIIGLSYIAIGLGFVVVASDILLRIYLEPDTDKLKEQLLFNTKFKSRKISKNQMIDRYKKFFKQS